MSACRSRPRRAPATILSAFDRKTHQAVLRPTSDVGWHLIRVCVTFLARFSFVGCFGIIWGMAKTTKLAFGPGIIVQGVAFRGNRWVVSAEGKGSRSCPGCGEASGSRHSWQMRRLQELPIQGVPATLEIRSGRWRCRNEQCARKTFAEALAIALPSARKNTASWRTRSAIRPCRRRPGQRTVADAPGNVCQRQRHLALSDQSFGSFWLW